MSFFWTRVAVAAACMESSSDLTVGLLVPPSRSYHDHLAEELRDVHAVRHAGNHPLQSMSVLLRVSLDLWTLKQESEQREDII